VRFALIGPSDYWRGLALGWIESTWPAVGVLEVLAELKDDRMTGWAVLSAPQSRSGRVW